MATIEKFEDLEIWQLARTINKEIYFEILRNLSLEDSAIRNQMDRSSGSIMDNIAEGFERNGTRELIQFLAIAKGSAGEVKSQLYRLVDRKKITEEQMNRFMYDINIILNKIGSFMNYLNKVNHKGLKFLKEPEVEYYPTRNHKPQTRNKIRLG